MQECLKEGQDLIGKVLEEAPTEITAVVACVPIPSAPPARQASRDGDRPTRPTDDQKVTKL
jgi:hypothetical protein